MTFFAVWFVIVDFAWSAAHHLAFGSSIHSSVFTYRVSCPWLLTEVTDVVKRFSVPSELLIYWVGWLTLVSIPFLGIWQLFLFPVRILHLLQKSTHKTAVIILRIYLANRSRLQISKFKAFFTIWTYDIIQMASISLPLSPFFSKASFWSNRFVHRAIFYTYWAFPQSMVVWESVCSGSAFVWGLSNLSNPKNRRLTYFSNRVRFLIFGTAGWTYPTVISTVDSYF